MNMIVQIAVQGLAFVLHLPDLIGTFPAIIVATLLEAGLKRVIEMPKKFEPTRKDQEGTEESGENGA